jgi:hypothetical protein
VRAIEEWIAVQARLPDVIPVVTRADLAWLEIARTMVSCRPLRPWLMNQACAESARHVSVWFAILQTSHSSLRGRRVREMHRRHAKSETCRP